VTFDLGATQMGASCVYLDHQGVRIGERESVKDMALNLERWVQLIVLRTYSHRVVTEFADIASVPVINGLSEWSHPCQGLTDYFTLTEKVGEDLRGFKLAYVGDGNNTCHSLIFGAAKLGAHITVGVPKGYEPDSEVLKLARKDAKSTGAKIEIMHDPYEAVAGADAVYTDVWASMGYEAETERRREIFSAFRVTKKLMKPKKARFSCITCPRIAAMKWTPPSLTKKAPSSTTRPKIACTRKKGSCSNSSPMPSNIGQ
jgi:ornithine carbamoyltransferase